MSVSTLWALGDEVQRYEIEAAHAVAVSEAMAHLTANIPTVRRRYEGQVVEESAVDLIAAEYRHTTARGVLESDAPDPQLHSHVVVTSAIREDGEIVAVASRPIFRAGREVGAYYRSALAQELAQRGYGSSAASAKRAATSRSRACRAALGIDGQDSDRVERLARNMRQSRAQTPSLAYPELPDPLYGPGFSDRVERGRETELPVTTGNFGSLAWLRIWEATRRPSIRSSSSISASLCDGPPIIQVRTGLGEAAFHIGRDSCTSLRIAGHEPADQ